MRQQGARLQGKPDKLPSSQLWRTGIPSKVRITCILGEFINLLLLSGYTIFLTLKGLKQLPRDFPITQVTWAAAPCLKTWEVKAPNNFSVP